MIAHILLGCMLQAVAAPTPAEPAAPAALDAAAPASALTKLPNFDSDTPPPSRYDQEHADEPLAPESRGLLYQLVRTVLALGVVIGLIYLIVKLLLPRFVRATVNKGATQLRLIERLIIDPRHTVALVEVAEGQRVLLGLGEGGVRLLTTVHTGKPSFNAALDAHAAAGVTEGRDAHN